MNTNEIKIEKGIPFPTRLGCKHRGGKWVDLLRRMEIGDSVLLPIVVISSVNSLSKRIGMKMRYQKQPDGITMRCWLAERKEP
jgi:hypothetical protein